MPRLTVIMPTLNQGRFIERSIRSVLDQRLDGLEFVVVDGGSTDETLEIIRRYADSIDWWVSEPDRGQTDALNKGLSRATGDVVGFLNSDDYYLPGAFDAALDALDHNGASWVAGVARNLDQRGEPTCEGEFWIPKQPDALELVPKGRHWWLLRHWAVPQPASFWRRELFEAHGGFRRDMNYAFDVEFMLRLVLAGERPVLLRDRILAVRCLHPAAKSFDTRPWPAEYRLMRQSLRPRLSRSERAFLRAGLMVWPPHRVIEYLRRWRVRVRPVGMNGETG